MIVKGIAKSKEFTVTDASLATSWGNDVRVLATPIILWWCELVCMDAVAAQLEKGTMTVGIAHDMRHLAPTREGALINISVVLAEINGRALKFSVQAHDGSTVVACGYHTRGIVERKKFIDGISRVE
ncbi:thioesterase family protein [Burkholderia sp. LMG 21824]|uniref:thioesterase family protein n=1 Tax=Burkholderia sp. LMG 21824 TaxID=3158172 RepID=UPI003C309764